MKSRHGLSEIASSILGRQMTNAFGKPGCLLMPQMHLIILNLQTSRKGHGHFPRFPENAEKLMIFPGVCCTCALQPWEQNCAVIRLMVSRMQNDIRWKPTLFVFRGPKAWTTHQGSRKTGNMRRTRNEGDLNSKPPNQG